MVRTVHWTAVCASPASAMACRAEMVSGRSKGIRHLGSFAGHSFSQSLGSIIGQQAQRTNMKASKILLTLGGLGLAAVCQAAATPRALRSRQTDQADSPSTKSICTDYQCSMDVSGLVISLLAWSCLMLKFPVSSPRRT